MSDLLRVIAEMRDAAADGDQPGFHVGETIARWADRLTALAAAAPPPDRNDLLGVGRAQSQHDASARASFSEPVPLTTEGEP